MTQINKPGFFVAARWPEGKKGVKYPNWERWTKPLQTKKETKDEYNRLTSRGAAFRYDFAVLDENGKVIRMLSKAG